MPSYFDLKPNLPQPARSLLQQFLKDLPRANRIAGGAGDLIRSLLESADLSDLDEADRLATRLFFEVAEDLVHHGWTFSGATSSLRAVPPGANNGRANDQKEAKRVLRKTLVTARDEQLSESTVKRFVRSMERPRHYRGREVSIRTLLLTPKDLTEDLKRRFDAPIELRDRLLRDAIQPYLQLATETRDDFTGLRLTDIWRYCRYTWSLPLHSQPGRQMLYLIRDAARASHPIVGIAALGNSVVQISCRDDTIGWSMGALSQLAKAAGTGGQDSERAQERLSSALRAIEEEIDAATDEILTDDLVEPSEIALPTADTLAKLQQIAESGSSLSQEGRVTTSDVGVDARTPFFRRKRAGELRRLLYAKRVLGGSLRINNPSARAASLLDMDEGRRALGIGLRSIKKRHIGSSMMEITTCGAISPYNELLGGKLVAMLMASPQVIADYRSRYDGSVSEIASRMKGEPVCRKPDLVFLGTTSLYHVGSSQYNRIRIPTTKGEIRYEYLGKTKGYGSVHLSGRTYRTLQALLRKHPDLNAESSGFASGVNYKLRSIASALSFLGMGKLQQHETPRLVYGVPLAKNWNRYLLGIDSAPTYLFGHIDEPDQETQEIVEHWKERWFLRRVARSDILSRLGHTKPIRVGDLVASQEAPVAPLPLRRRDVTPLEASPEEGEMMDSSDQLSWQTLVSLNGQRGSFAEKLKPKELAELHVATKIDSGILPAVQAGKRIYLTGNPGDGKTYVIERHMAALEAEGVLPVKDGSETSEEDVVDRIVSAINDGRAAVIAINEGPLRRLLPNLPEPDRSAVQRQLDQPFLYGDVADPNCEALVVNLGIRQTLSPTIVDQALRIVLDRIDYTDAPDGIRRNRDLIATFRVRERLGHLLHLASQGGAHATMHELFGFLSYVVTGRPGDEKVAPYYSLAFTEESPLGRHLGELDPATISHPSVDAALWDGNYGQYQWTETPQDKPPLVEEEGERRMVTFEALKRRFYFEAAEGDVVLRLGPQDRRDFRDLLTERDRANQSARVKIADALSRFFGTASQSSSAESGIRIWTSLRYEVVSPPTAFLSSRTIS